MKTNASNEILGYNGPYLERGGVRGVEMIEKLIQPSERPLSNEEKVEAYAFSEEVFTHEIDTGESVEAVIRNKKDGDDAPFFFSQAFLENKITFPEHAREAVPDFTSAHDVYAWLAHSIEDGSLTPSELRDIAKESGAYYREQVAGNLAADEPLPPELLDMKPLVLEPVEFIEAAGSLAQVREYLLGLRANYTEDRGNLEGAKRAFIDTYLAKVNSEVINTVSIADALYEQSILIGDESTAVASMVAIPSGFRHVMENDDGKVRLFQRLDFMSNGLGINHDGDQEKASAVHHTVTDHESASEVEQLPEHEAFMKILKETMISPDDIQKIMTAILARAGKLSSEPASTWTPSRGKRAEDELFQVVEHTTTSFGVNGIDGVYKTPAKERSLYDVLVIGGFHELTHIDQAEADRLVGDTIHIAALRGKRLSVLRESGADVNQRAAEQELFGVSKPVALTYAKALQSLERGEGLAGATKAFYDEKRRINPKIKPETAAREAADRALRLIENGGRNSKAMSYAEGGVFVAELANASKEVQRRAGMISSLDFVDQVRLHRYGLLPEIDAVGTDWKPHIEVVLEPYIQVAIEKATSTPVQ